MAKKAQTEAKAIKPVKDKCRKRVPPADFSGFKILNWILRGKRSYFIPFSLLGAQSFATTGLTCHVSNKYRGLPGASLAGVVQRGGAGSSVAPALRTSLPVTAEPEQRETPPPESLGMSTYIMSLRKIQAKSMDICGHLKCSTVYVFCEQFWFR